MFERKLSALFLLRDCGGFGKRRLVLDSTRLASCGLKSEYSADDNQSHECRHHYRRFEFHEEHRLHRSFCQLEDMG